MLAQRWPGGARPGGSRPRRAASAPTACCSARTTARPRSSRRPPGSRRLPGPERSRYDAPAMTTSRGEVPADLTRVRFVSDAHVSPDGRVLAFVVTTLSEYRDEHLSQIRPIARPGIEARHL